MLQFEGNSLASEVTHIYLLFSLSYSRELQFKVKGISMSVFTAEDVADVAAGGNVAHNLLYMAKYQAKDVPVPNGSDVGKLRDFIKSKYNDKKWYSNGSSGSDRVSSSGSTEVPTPVSDSSDLWGTKKSSTSRGPVAIRVRLHLNLFT
jgi:hypothetical protein